MVKPIKSEVSRLASKLGLDIADLSAFGSVIKWERNTDVQRPPAKADSQGSENVDEDNDSKHT